MLTITKKKYCKPVESSTLTRLFGPEDMNLPKVRTNTPPVEGEDSPPLDAAQQELLDKVNKAKASVDKETFLRVSQTMVSLYTQANLRTQEI